MKNTPMPLDLIFIAQDGTVRGGQAGRAVVGGGHLARRAGALRARAEGRAPPQKNGIEDGDKLHRHRGDRAQASPAAMPVSMVQRHLKGDAGKMQFFSHEGFDLAYHRPAPPTAPASRCC